MKNLKKSFSTNRNRLLCFVLYLLTSISHAALPPDFQNEKDLADILTYIKSNHEVLSDLRVIDLAELTVYYGESCRIQFARKVVKREVGWVGPAEPVEFKAKDCMDDQEASGEKLVPEDKIAHGVIVSVEAGDTACFLQIKDDTGKMHDELASFDLCEDKTLLNKPSEFVYERISVMAASCDGDTECSDTEFVWFIADIK